MSMEPRERHLPGILMEFKAAKDADEEKLHELAKRGLEQIGSRKYETEFADRGVLQIVKYGIAFCGKDVEVIVNN